MGRRRTDVRSQGGRTRQDARDGATTGTIYGTGVPFKSQLEKLPIGDNLNGATTSLKLGEESSELKFASGPDAGSVNFDDLANNADKKFLAVKGTIPKAGGYTCPSRRASCSVLR